MKTMLSRRGSVLITCLLFSALIAISLTSYLTLANTSYKMADRAFLNTSAMALAEQGLEEGLECYNQLDNVSPATLAWNGWTINGTVATLKNASIALDNRAVGTIRVYATDYNPAAGIAPKLVAKATVLPATGAGLSRMVELTLKRRTIFAVGLIAKYNITFTANTNVSSWNSDPDDNPATPPIPYSAAVKTANCFVGSVSNADGAINTAAGDIFGRIGTGGGTVSHDSGATLTGNPVGSGWDSSLVNYGFAMNLPIPVAPTLPVGAGVYNIASNVVGNNTFPRGGDVPAADGKYYYNFASGAGIAMTGNSQLTIANGNVVFYLQNHAGVTAISVTGNGKIQITNTGTLALYTNGDIHCAGNGMANANQNATSCLIYGTNTGSGQTFDFNGNATTITAINAPNADFTITGNGEVRGSVIARNASLVGNAGFRFDEALLKFVNTTGTGNPWGIAKWREMTQSTERATYAANFNF